MPNEIRQNKGTVRSAQSARGVGETSYKPIRSARGPSRVKARTMVMMMMMMMMMMIMIRTEVTLVVDDFFPGIRNSRIISAGTKSQKWK